MSQSPRRAVWPAAVLGGAVAVAALAADRQFASLEADALDTARLGALFLTLIFGALVIERAVEVFIGNLFDPEEARLMGPQRQKEQERALVIGAIESETQRARGASVEQKAALRTGDTLDKLRAEADALRGELTEIRRETLEEVISFRARKTAAASAAAVGLGAAAAAAGLRVLEPLATDAALVEIAGIPGQMFWFRLVDVTLTALLLAGGADGIHQVLKAFLGRKADLAGAAR